MIVSKILVIGGNGFVGSILCRMGKARGYDIAVIDIADRCNFPESEYYKCDISNFDEVQTTFEKAKPSLAVNVAAIANIDLAQVQPKLAYAVNVLGAENCAIAAKQVGARYIWFSSDAVFSGEDAKYTEDIKTNPVNYYGKTKQIGEEKVLSANKNAVILRLSLILGIAPNGRNSFMNKLLIQIKNRENLICPADEIRTPIDVFTLCNAIYELDTLPYAGILHLGALSSVNRYELTRYIAMQVVGETSFIKAGTTALPGRAPRHKNGVLSVKKAQDILIETKLVSWQETVKRALLTMKG